MGSNPTVSAQSTRRLRSGSAPLRAVAHFSGIDDYARSSSWIEHLTTDQKVGVRISPETLDRSPSLRRGSAGFGHESDAEQQRRKCLGTHNGTGRVHTISVLVALCGRLRTVGNAHSLHASERPMTRRPSCRQDVSRWSASFSLTIVNASVHLPIAVNVCDADLESLLKGLVRRASSRFRFNGKSGTDWSLSSTEPTRQWRFGTCYSCDH